MHHSLAEGMTYEMTYRMPEEKKVLLDAGKFNASAARETATL
ncbi:MAG: hypothetical protein ACOWWM_02335 [Desulfobacterales bacterium]